MTRHGFTNMDSRALAQLAERIKHSDPLQNALCKGGDGPAATIAALLRIADNLQRLDEANQILSNNRTYEQGVADAEARMRRRSNVLANPDGEDEKGAAILRQIDQRVAEGAVKRVAMGERALEDKPHMFNAPARRAQLQTTGPVDVTRQRKPKPSLDIFLDLDFLGEI